MKKLFVLLAFATIGLTACTDNEMARSYGGTETIQLTPGRQVLNVTWKETDLWILTKRMDSAYVPDTVYFQEKSTYGIHEGTIILIESK
jgi:hypothetical protein